jgi:hypothetical protein
MTRVAAFQPALLAATFERPNTLSLLICIDHIQPALSYGTMAYNYGAPPGAFGGHQPSYGTPVMAPPGMDAPPAAAPAQFNIPGVNFNAPVIRLGMDQKTGPPVSDRDRDRDRGARDGRGGNTEFAGGNSRRAGLGADGGSRNLERDRAQIRESMLSVQPPTREEVARTIFVGGMGDDAPHDEAIENILRCAGKLRRWTRARDADDKKCKFGFAEYEDVDSLEAANELFGQGIEVPAFKAGQLIREGENNDIKQIKLHVVIDEQSHKYIEEWTSKRNEDDDARQFRLDGCREDVRQCLTSITNADSFMANAGVNGDGETDANGADGENPGDENAEVVNIPLTAQTEDDLADVPEDMRATVAAEIRNFRERSNRRDLDRLRQEEELEQKERQRAAGSRLSRLASPPRVGPAGSTNGVPLGPRDRTAGLSGAPSGPRGHRGQMPSDYVNGVTFVGANGAVNGISLNREDEDAEESDEELEARRRKRREDELEKQYLDQERKWLNRERVSGSARQRDRENEARSNEQKQRQKEVMLERLRKWNDDEENRLGHEEYYVDRSAWLRKRGAYRDTEARRDDLDRANEVKEASSQQTRDAEARGQADAFLDQLDSDIATRSAAEPAASGGPFKLNLGAAKNKVSAAAAAAAPVPKRFVADLEGLLDDEEDAATSGRKTSLKPLADTSTLPTNGADLSDEDRAVARQQLAAEIPSDVDALFAYKIRWASLSSENIETQIRPMVEKKVVEYLGVQEELLVHALVDGIKNHRAPEELVGELEPALEEEAKLLVKKVWRLVVFLSESEGRGLN